jgi:peptidoglycan/LPS O-acetylase OafA/YrhL
LPYRNHAELPSRAAGTAHIPSLDGIRAISFLIVFCAHMGAGDIVPGGLGVTIFFFLSGFLITTLMRDEQQRKGSVSLRHFWIRRVLRIFPPFYIVLVGSILFTFVYYPPGTLAVPAVAAQLLHFTNYWIIYHGYDHQPPGTGVYWSLAVEEHFYLVFPWVFVGMQRLRMSGKSQSILLWTVCGLALLWRFVLVTHFHSPTDRTYIASDTRMDSILFGCALAVWNNPVLDAVSLNERRWKYWLAPLGVALLLLSLVFRNPVFRETARYTLQGAALTLLFIAAIAFPRWWPFRVLNTKPMQKLGTLSYTLYLVHQVMLFGFEKSPLHSLPVARTVAAFAGALAFAWLVYRYVERPCAVLRRRLTD